MKLIGLKKKIGSFELDIPVLDIEAGKIHGLIGPNGSGKSILLKMIMGIIKPDEGEIDYEGIELSQVTLMPQNPFLLKRTVYENIIYPLKVRGVTPDEEQIDKLLARANMLQHKNQHAASLSSGERQKLSFLRAVIFEPKLIMMDETLSNLDTASEETIIEMIKENQAAHSATWIIVSHQLESKEGLCDEMHHIANGEVLD